MNKALNTLTIIALVAFLNACSDAPEESAPPAQEQEIALPASLEPEPEEAPVAAQPVEEAKTPEPVQAVASTPAPEADLNIVSNIFDCSSEAIAVTLSFSSQNP